MEVISNPSKEEWKKIFERPGFDTKKLESTVAGIIDDIRNNGDNAVKEYVKKFDSADLDSFEVSNNEIDNAEDKLDEKLKSAIRLAAFNIEKFHVSQFKKTKIIETTDGVKCWQKSVAIEKVGLYIPGGTAPLFSTVLMLAIPAKIAGCKELVLCTPSNDRGEINPAILYVAKITGVTKLFKIGGVQAIAAMAYGTESVPKVNKIFGPGNQYVTCAKQLVSRDTVAIDMPAGPSEVAVVADEHANPDFIASDLLSQAEHGADSQVLLFTNSTTIISKVEKAIATQISELTRSELAQKALENSKIILIEDKQLIFDAVNEYAPEHLILMLEDHLEAADKIVNAGSVFLGSYTPESAGDYASGTNHTLPTNGWAKSYSGVNLDSYLKKITFQELSKEGINNLGETIAIMAEAEGLDAHANAARIRMK